MFPMQTAADSGSVMKEKLVFMSAPIARRRLTPTLFVLDSMPSHLSPSTSIPWALYAPGPVMLTAAVQFAFIWIPDQHVAGIMNALFPACLMVTAPPASTVSVLILMKMTLETYETSFDLHVIYVKLFLSLSFYVA